MNKNEHTRECSFSENTRFPEEKQQFHDSGSFSNKKKMKKRIDIPKACFH